MRRKEDVMPLGESHFNGVKTGRQGEGTEEKGRETWWGKGRRRKDEIWRR